MSRSELDRYELGGLLGIGTVGKIFSATDLETGKKVAIKRLNVQACADPLIRARFKREISILQRLRHPNIVSYFNSGNEDASLFYAMELVDGGTVKSALESGGPLPWQSVVAIAIPLCSALQCAHNHGVIHRDLKPGNLFLSTDGDVKLGDFGIARDLHHADLTEAGFAVGTHAYMAPEQIRGEASVSDKADLYALGCCLYEMLTGRKPFSGESYAKLFDQHLKAPPPRVKEIAAGIPQELDDIVNELLQKAPEDRPFNARKVQAVLLRLTEPSKNEAPTIDSPVIVEGKEVLKTRIRDRFLTPTAPPISFVPLLVVLGLIVLVVVIATAMRS